MFPAEVKKSRRLRELGNGSLLLSDVLPDHLGSASHPRMEVQGLACGMIQHVHMIYQVEQGARGRPFFTPVYTVCIRKRFLNSYPLVSYALVPYTKKRGHTMFHGVRPKSSWWLSKRSGCVGNSHIYWASSHNSLPLFPK